MAPRTLIDEISRWWQAFCLAAPGRVGNRLRKRLFARRQTTTSKTPDSEPGLWVRGWENLSLGAGISIGRNCTFECSAGTLKMGNDVALNANVHIGADFGVVEIGDQVIIGMNVVIRAADHKFDRSPEIPIRQQGHRSTTVKIGNDVWIGANVSILPGASIGDHCVIGAGAVVADDIPSGWIAVGVPAKAVRRIVEPGDKE